MSVLVRLHCEIEDIEINRNAADKMNDIVISCNQRINKDHNSCATHFAHQQKVVIDRINDFIIIDICDLVVDVEAEEILRSLRTFEIHFLGTYNKLSYSVLTLVEPTMRPKE